MKFAEALRQRKKPLIVLCVWTVFWLLVSSLGTGTIQTVSLVLLLATILGAGCYAVFLVMRAIH